MNKETVVEAIARRPYVLTVTFADGFRRDIDLEPLHWGEVFQPLRDWEYFAQVRVDEELGTVIWPNGADLAPEFLYYGEDTPHGRVHLPSPEEVTVVAADQR